MRTVFSCVDCQTKNDFVPYDIVSLAMNYVTGDYDTDGTKWLEERIEMGLGLRR